MADQVRLGIIGYGAQGGMYARLVTEGKVPSMSLAAVADTDPQRREAVMHACPDVPVYSTYEELLDSGEVDAVVTTVPHYLHPEVGMAALGKGIHALIEKPAAVYTKQVRELNDFAASHPELTFGIMFNQRNNPLYKAIKDIVDSGQIGPLRHTNWVITTWWRPQGYYDQSAWRATWGGEGGGVLVNQAPHQLDLWQWICGVPKTVFAKAAYGFKRDIAVEDEVTALVDFGEGVTGVLVTATHDIVGTDRLEILGDSGKIVVDGSKTATVTRLSKPEQDISAEVDVATARKLFSGQAELPDYSSTETLEFESQWGGQHGGVLENFARNILDGTELLAPGSDGINGVRLANAIHLSSWLGKEVPLDFDEQHYLDELNRRIADEGGDWPARD